MCIRAKRSSEEHRSYSLVKLQSRNSMTRNEQHNLFLIISRRNLNNSHLWKIHRAPYDHYYKINFWLVFFRFFDGALETSNFGFEEARSAITLIRCFLHENTQRGKMAGVKFAEELGTMSKNRLRWITLVGGPIWGIHSLSLMISCLRLL